MATATWRKLLDKELQLHGDQGGLLFCTLSSEELDREFDDGFGGHEGKPFTAWTKTRVYFPVVYDGAEWVDSVPRHPNGEPTEHVGGQ